MASSSGEEVLNLMLIGKTGEGKSATGNTILGHRMFTESSKTTSVTKDIVSKFTRFDNLSLKVVNCPGLMDIDSRSEEEEIKAALNMATALGMCNGGVDAFILVITRERFTDENTKSLEALKKILGDNYLQNLIVVVTGGDKFKKDMKNEGRGDMSFKEWCSQESGAFKQLCDDFSDRFLLINNREKNPQKKETQRREIIQLADSLRKLNGRYACQSFEEAKALRDKFIVEENLPMLNESLQVKVGLLAADLLKLKKAPSDRERERILQSLDNLKNELTETDEGTGLLNHYMAKVEQVKIALYDVDELHCLAEEMENIREEKSSWSRYGEIAVAIVLAEVGAIVALVPLAVLGLLTLPVVGVARTVGWLSLAENAFTLGKTEKSDQEQQDLYKSEKQRQTEKDSDSESDL